MARAAQSFLQINRLIMQRVTGNQVTTKSTAINRSHHVGGGKQFNAAQLKPGNGEKCFTWFLATSTCARSFPFQRNSKTKQEEGRKRSLSDFSFQGAFLIKLYVGLERKTYHKSVA